MDEWIKEEGNPVICDLEGILQREKPGAERQTLCDLSYLWNLQNQSSQKQRIYGCLPGTGKGGRGEVLVRECKLLVMK